MVDCTCFNQFEESKRHENAHTAFVRKLIYDNIQIFLIQGAS
jgi:hypothetical protein